MSCPPPPCKRGGPPCARPARRLCGAGRWRDERSPPAASGAAARRPMFSVCRSRIMIPFHSSGLCPIAERVRPKDDGPPLWSPRRPRVGAASSAFGDGSFVRTMLSTYLPAAETRAGISARQPAPGGGDKTNRAGAGAHSSTMPPVVYMSTRANNNCQSDG